MRRLLYVAANFLPAGGAAVLRALKTVKYLPDFGWRATVLTSDGQTDIHRDETLQVPPGVEVIRVRSPLAFLRRRREGGNPGAAPSGKAWSLRRAIIREALVPDSEGPWSLAAARVIRRAVAAGSFDAVLSTSPIPSSHVAVRLALGSRRGRRVPWLADVQDPWLDAALRSHQGRSWTLLDRVLERACLGSVDALVCVNEQLLELYRDRYHDLRDRPGAAVHNGYDPDDFAGEIAPVEGELGSIGSSFDLVFTGRFYDEVSPDQGLAAALGELARARPDFARDARLFLIGPRDPAFEPHLRGSEPARVVRHMAVPYRVAIACQRRASVLVLLGGGGRFAQATRLKVYEYLAARRPILAQVVRGGELARFLEKHPNVRFAALEDGARGLVPVLTEMYDLWRAGRLEVRDDRDIEQFSRRTQTGAIASLLDTLVRSPQGTPVPQGAAP